MNTCLPPENFTLEQAAERVNSIIFTLIPPGADRQRMLAAIAQLTSFAIRETVKQEPLPNEIHLSAKKGNNLRLLIGTLGYNALALTSYPDQNSQEIGHILGVISVQLAKTISWPLHEMAKVSSQLYNTTRPGAKDEKPN